MSETTMEQPRIRTYGNISDTKITGIMGLSLAATAVAGVGAVGALLVLWFSQQLWLTGLLLALTVPATWLLHSKDRNARSKAEKMVAKRMRFSHRAPRSRVVNTRAAATISPIREGERVTRRRAAQRWSSSALARSPMARILVSSPL